VPEPSEAARRRRPQTVGGAVYLAVAGAVAIGLALVSVGNWRAGLVAMALALLGAAGVRAVLPDRVAGMLKVRHKVIDVVTLAGLGGTLLFVVLALGRS
jgi:hypothetical protein